MDSKQFRRIHQILNDNYHRSIEELGKEYALSNNSVKIGDIIQGNRYYIKVEKIIVKKIPTSYYLTECLYSGKKLKKDGSFFKNDLEGFIYQTDLKKINGIKIKKL